MKWLFVVVLAAAVAGCGRQTGVVSLAGPGQVVHSGPAAEPVALPPVAVPPIPSGS